MEDLFPMNHSLLLIFSRGTLLGVLSSIIDTEWISLE